MASDKTTMWLEGAEELQRAMEALPLKIQRRVVPPALRAAAKPMVQAGRRRLSWNKRAGLLAKSIGTKLARKRSEHTRLLVVGPRSQKYMVQIGDRTIPVNPANYAHLVEYGTASHQIQPRSAGIGVSSVLGPMEGGQELGYAPSVQHPGAEAYPFMRPAFDTQKHRSSQAYIEKGVAQIEKEAARLHKTP